MYKYLKRVMDVIISFILLTLGIIPMILIGIAIKLESRGPVFFKQRRTGQNGKDFYLYKFRSMHVNNDMLKLNFNEENKITKVGSLIRKTSLDELPQLLNILKGDMSLIGPRPWIVQYYQNFTDYQKRRVEVRPGITGLAQAIGRNDLSIFEKIYYDIEYVDHYSLKMDLKVILLTIKTVLLKAGAEITKSGIEEELKELKEYYLSTTGTIPMIEEKQQEPKEKVA